MADNKRSKLASKILVALEQRYGRKPKPPNWDYIETLLFYLIYHSSNITAARRAFKALKEEYVDLNEVRVSTLGEIRVTLNSAGANPEAAYQIRSLLKQIYLRENAITLQSLAEAGPEEIKSYFSRMEHLPQHATDYLLLIRCAQHILPVDSQVARMAARVGLIAPRASEESAQRSLMKVVESERYFDFYSLFLEHASKVCSQHPNCARCVLLQHCRHGKRQKNVKVQSPNAKSNPKSKLDI